jgi:hypothetical protein
MLRRAYNRGYRRHHCERGRTQKGNKAANSSVDAFLSSTPSSSSALIFVVASRFVRRRKITATSGRMASYCCSLPAPPNSDDCDDDLATSVELFDADAEEKALKPMNAGALATADAFGSSDAAWL